MSVTLWDRLLKATSLRIEEISKRAVAEVQAEYEDFFRVLYDLIMDTQADADSTPGLLAPFTAWASLSPDWTDRKNRLHANEGFYSGLTDVTGPNKPKRLGRTTGHGFARIAGAKRAPEGGNSSFSTYLESLTPDGVVDKFFGPIAVTFEITGTGMQPARGQGTEIVAQLTAAKVAKRPRGKLATLPKDLKIAVTVEAFTTLDGLSLQGPAGEWFMVDYILKRIDPAHEKQWVKINSEYGIGRTKRPIRPLITPLISWYFQRAFPDAVRRALA